MAELKYYPPSGKILMLMGAELNSCPPPVLLQVIEWQMANRIGDFRITEAEKAELQVALHKRLQDFKPRAE